jgi:hypothetical protein
MPLEQVILAYLGALLKRKAQRIAVNGDVDSLNPDLVHFDGFRKMLKADAEVNVVYYFSYGKSLKIKFKSKDIALI